MSEIEKYLLKHDKKNVSVKKGIWQADEIYLSDICLLAQVIIFSSENERRGFTDKDKSDLYELLAFISFKSRQLGAPRPMVGWVVVNDKDKDEIKNWIADQNWHRGEFSLFVQGAHAALELKDLLILSPEMLSKAAAKHLNPENTLEATFEKLKNNYEPLPELIDVKELLHEILLRKSSSESERNKLIRNVFYDFRESVKSKIR